MHFNFTFKIQKKMEPLKILEQGSKPRDLNSVEVHKIQKSMPSMKTAERKEHSGNNLP